MILVKIIMLKELGINVMKILNKILKLLRYDIDLSNVKTQFDDIAMQFLDIDISELLPNNQTSLPFEKIILESNIKVMIIK